MALGVTFVLLAGLTVAVALSGCHIGYHFRGPGFSDEHGVTAEGAGDTVVVAITAGTIRRGEGGAFFRHLRLVMDNLPEQRGLIGYAVRKKLVGRRVWTLSAWTDERALDRFVRSEPHRAAMAAGGIPRDSVRSVRIELPANELPISWARAQQILEAQTDGGVAR